MLELIDNKSKLLGDNLKLIIKKGANVKMVASYFSICCSNQERQMLYNG